MIDVLSPVWQIFSSLRKEGGKCKRVSTRAQARACKPKKKGSRSILANKSLSRSLDTSYLNHNRLWTQLLPLLWRLSHNPSARDVWQNVVFRNCWLREPHVTSACDWKSENLERETERDATRLPLRLSHLPAPQTYVGKRASNALAYENKIHPQRYKDWAFYWR
jgi:hypothetical protein